MAYTDSPLINYWIDQGSINQTKSEKMKDQNIRYKCLECGRNTFLYKAWHQCNGVFKNPGNWEKSTVKIKD